MISNVEKNSPADNAGLQVGDILCKISDFNATAKYVEDLPKIYWHLTELEIDKPINLTIKRNNNLLVKTIMPVLKEKIDASDFDCKEWNMTVKEINKFKNAKLYYYSRSGVYVQGVKFPGNANNAGILIEDIILKVDNIEIKSLSDFKKIYEQIIKDQSRIEKKVMLEIQRGAYKRWIVLDYSIDYNKE